MPDDALFVNPHAALEALRPLQGAPDVAALRVVAADIIADLHAPDCALLAGPQQADANALPLSYLLNALAQIAAAHTFERAHYYLDRLRRSLTAAPRTNGLNDLDLNRWQSYAEIITDSWWPIERRDSSGVHSAGYWGNFVPQIPFQMLQRYTQRGDWVLDVFAGLGTTLIEGQRLGRNVLGIELQADIAAQAQQLVAAEPNPHDVVCRVVPGDSAAFDIDGLLAAHGQQQVQLLMLHPPYFDIIKFSDDPRDLSNTASVEAFLAQLSAVAARALPLLAAGRYLVLVIGDKYARGEWVPLGFRAMDTLLSHGCTLKSIVVKNFEQTAGKRQQEALWRYRALAGGFYVFKHEYIFVLQKPAR